MVLKLIEAMKQKKELMRKANDLRLLVRDNCACLDNETPQYGNEQGKQIKSWMDAHHDILQEVMKIGLRIQKTNIQTEVTITLDGKDITMTIAAWILRRGQGKLMKGLSYDDLLMWSMLTDRGLKETKQMQSTGQAMEIKIKRFFDPAERDRMKELYISEAQLIDARLEVVNATTELLE
jgi:hypothetical protein